MADSVIVRITENRLVVTKENKKVSVAAPYVKNENNYTARLVILGYYDTLSDLTTAVTSPSEGDPYGVGTEAPYTIYIWNGTEWKDNGTLKGEKGDPTEWIRGTVDPTTEGIDGDLYLNYTTWHVWEKISGTWEDKGTIKGADGADGAGTGDVIGPSSAVGSNFAAFDGITGKLIKDSGKAIADFAEASHSHSYAPIPSSSSLPVGTWCFCYNNATSDIANGGTVAGSNLKIFRLSLQTKDSSPDDGSLILGESFIAGSLSGTWKNITGTTVKKYNKPFSIATRHTGLFVRTA